MMTTIILKWRTSFEIDDDQDQEENNLHECPQWHYSKHMEKKGKHLKLKDTNGIGTNSMKNIDQVKIEGCL